MREESVLLKDIADVTFTRRKVDFCACPPLAEERHAIQCDFAAVGRHQSGNGIEGLRFARARSAEQHADACANCQLNLQVECAELFFDVNNEPFVLLHSVTDLLVAFELAVQVAAPTTDHRKRVSSSSPPSDLPPRTADSAPHHKAPMA